MNNGELVTDEIVIELLKNRIKKPDCSNGYVLDGFPRNISQAEKYLKILEEFNLPLGDVIYLELPKEIAKKELLEDYHVLIVVQCIMTNLRKVNQKI